MFKSVRNLVLCIFLLFALSLPAFGVNRVDTMDIQAILYEDGSMHITQSWSGRFDEGTESYIPMNAPDYLTISELQVSDQYGPYETLTEWDIDWSFEEKARKCGINYTDEGYEICFGISQYGQNRYTISYKLENAVGAYSDKDGVNFRFVNDQMNTPPTKVTVQIRLADGTAITDDIADVWGFGFTGQVGFENGSIVARTDTPLSAENHVTVLISLEKGILSPARLESGSFEEVRERAFEGSDYSTGEDFPILSALIPALAGMFVPIWLAEWYPKNTRKKKQQKLRQLSERFGYFRELPNEGNLSASYVLGRVFEVCDDGAVLAAGILRLIQLDCLVPVQTTEAKFLGKTKEIVNLRLQGARHDLMNEYDEYLYTVLEAAAGDDGILQEKELERFARKNDQLLRTYLQKHDSAGKTYLMNKRCFKQWKIPFKLKDLTASGEQELGQLLGFKRYLEDFSLIAERGVRDLPIWREMLIYAMLFGIADQLAEQLKELYPSLSPELEYYGVTVGYANHYRNLLYTNMIRAEQQREQARIGGSGGAASFGGGGGSIGGGSGGGTR